MEKRVTESRASWLVVGVAAGLCVSYFWPHEPAQAVVTDSNDKFALATCTVELTETVEAIFVLDFLTGRLQGAILNNRVGKFTNFYFRNVAADFQLDPNATPQFAIATGRVNLPSRGSVTWATGCIYVAEMTTGKVVCYAFPYRITQRPVAPEQLQVIDGFPFRQSVEE